jgi:hypothetical protein
MLGIGISGEAFFGPGCPRNRMALVGYVRAFTANYWTQRGITSACYAYRYTRDYSSIPAMTARLKIP